MGEPRRIQRRRTTGWRLPAETVYVGRPTRWGNPFKVGETIVRESPLAPYVEPGGWRDSLISVRLLRPELVVDAYLSWIIEQPQLMLSLGDLTGCNLACWCSLDQPCHADALLEMAN